MERCVVTKSGNRQQDLLLEILNRSVSTTLRFTVAGVSYDTGPVGEPKYELIVHDDSFFYRVLAYGNLGFGEAWMDGHIEMSQGPLHDLLTVLAAAQPFRFVKNHARLLLYDVQIAHSERFSYSG